MYVLTTRLCYALRWILQRPQWNVADVKGTKTGQLQCKYLHKTALWYLLHKFLKIGIY